MQNEENAHSSATQKSLKSLNGKKYLLPNYVWTYFNRNNQTFTKLRNILKEYFLKPRIGF